jgi:hypothetical protein
MKRVGNAQNRNGKKARTGNKVKSLPSGPRNINANANNAVKISKLQWRGVNTLQMKALKAYTTLVKKYTRAAYPGISNANIHAAISRALNRAGARNFVVIGPA